MKNILKRYKIGFLAALFATTSILASYQPVFALDGVYDARFYANSHIFNYNPQDGSCSGDNFTIGNINNLSYNNNPVFSSSELTAVVDNQPFYAEAADAVDIPWQLIAAVHYREYRFKREGPENKNGPYQIVGTDMKVGVYTDEEFQAATNAAAEFIKNKVGDVDFEDENNVKKALFAYNGTADVYITQATALGFSEAEAALGEGSPYVMNRADGRRDPTVQSVAEGETWGQILTDGGDISYPANTDFGAFIVYMALTGEGADGSCSIGEGGLTLEQGQKFMQTYLKINDGDPNGDKQFTQGFLVCNTSTDNCVTFSGYFVNKYTDYTGQSTVGSKVAKAVADANGGLEMGNLPRPFAVFSTQKGRTLCGDEGARYICGHTGIVLGVDSETDSIIVGEAAWCGSSGAANRYSLAAWSDGTYDYTYMDGHYDEAKIISDAGGA